MKNLLLSACLLVASNILSAQNTSKADIGAVYSFILNSEFATEQGEIYSIKEHYIHFDGRYHLKKRWWLGLEYNQAILKGREPINNPFYLAGATVDFDILAMKKAAFNLRAGASVGNLRFVGDELPIKKTAIYRIIGFSFDYKIYKNFKITTGYYNHFAINRMQFEYSIAQPFVGARLDL